MYQKRMKILYVFFSVFILTASISFGQEAKPKNLPKYDKQFMHFGMSLGLNTMDFTIRPSSNIFHEDSVYAVENLRQPGFNINIVTNYNLLDNLSLRFLPGLLFGERDLRYTVRNTDTTFSTVLMRIESTFLDFPFLIKYKSDRLNNFRAYLIGGGSFKYDLAAKDQIKPEEKPLIRLKKPDYYYEIGAGFDFFLEYFKFAIELKLAVGIRNVIVYDDSQFTTSIEKMNSKMVILSFLFEGSDLSNFNIFTKRR
jgi:hypothetical protein